MGVNLTGSHTGLTLARLASQFCSELGPAQPQLVCKYKLAAYIITYKPPGVLYNPETCLC